MEEEESGNGRRLGNREREREKKLFHALERDVTPSPSPPSSLNANRGEIKKATGWPPANCPSQTWHTLRECSLREHNPRINPRKTSLSGFYEGREGGKKRRVYVCAPSRRANRSIFVFFRSSPAPPPPPLSSFLFLSLSSSRESRLKEFFLPLRVDAWGLAWKKRKTTTRLWNSTAVQLNPRWHAVRDEKRQQTFTPSPPPLFHEFYNSAYPSSRAGFFFLFFTNMVGENFNSINPETRMWVNIAGSKGTCVISLQGRFSGEKIDKPCLTVN